ncbi:MAG TPA: Rid family detoxifying hydrolase [Polyangia bacterium]|nr:Rid family detoxifying hydrolase [Polyangia bacterium]
MSEISEGRSAWRVFAGRRWPGRAALFALALGALPSASWAETPPPQAVPGRGTGRQVIRPARFPETGLPYSPGILVGDTLYLSGQIGRDPATAKLVPGGIEAETRQTLANLREVLRAAGMDLPDVVSVTVFIASFDDFAAFNRVYREHFPENPPARATVQVAALNLGARVEIQMTAVRSQRAAAPK